MAKFLVKNRIFGLFHDEEKGASVHQARSVVQLDVDQADPLVKLGALEAAHVIDEDVTDLDTMTKAQLVQLGKEKFGLDLSESSRKDELIKTIDIATECAREREQGLNQ